MPALIGITEQRFGRLTVLGRDEQARRAERRAISVTPPAKRCLVCGALFMPKRAGALYCRNECRQWAYRRRHALAYSIP